jgi:hypothetical protein
MRPDQNDAPDRDTAGSLADGREDVATSTEPFGDDAYDEEVFDDDSYGDDSYGDDSYEEDVFEDDGDFGDGTTEPVEGGGDADLDVVGHDNDPLEGVGYLIEELREALLGEDDGSEVEIVDDGDLDLAGDGSVDGSVDAHDLDEAGSVLDLDVSDG